MNKKTLEIAGWALGLSMAVAGIGLAVGATQKAPIEARADSETISYGGSTTTNMNGSNQAELLGMSSSTNWSVIGNTGSHTLYPGLNKNGYIALYYNATQSNYITISSGVYNIESVVITAITNYDNFTVHAGSSPSASTVSKSSGSYAINGSAFTIYNANTSNVQVRITEIEVVYSSEATDYRTTAVSISGSLAGSYTTETASFNNSGFSVLLHQEDNNGIADPRDIAPSTTVTYHWEYSAGGEVTLPLAQGSYSVKVWASVDGVTPNTKNNDDPSKQYVTGTLIVAKLAPTAADSISRSDLDFGSETKGYQNFTVKASGRASKALYAGSAYMGDGKTDTTYIQLKSADSISGLITTSSGGKKAKSIRVVFDNSTGNNKVLDIYGSNTAYTGSDASALYDNATKGTKVSSFTKTSSDTDFSYNFVSNYKYIGVRSNSGAVYLTSVTITWEQYEAADVAAEIKTLAGSWTNNVATASCGDHYKAAKEMILTLSDSELNTFKTSEDTDIAAARTTYVYWCARNNDATPYSGEIKSASTANFVPVEAAASEASVYAIAAIFGASVIGAAGYAFIRRRKEN